MDPVKVPATFEVRSVCVSTVPEIIGVSKEFGSGYAHAPFLQNWAFVRMDPINVLTKFEFRSFTRSWDNSDWTFGFGSPSGVANLQSWGTVGRRVSGMVRFERVLVSSNRPSIITFPAPLRVSEILSLLCSSMSLFAHPTSSLPQIFPCSPGIRWMAFGLRRAKVLG